MRRLIMAPALLAALALAGPAEARVEQKTVSESASSIESYWTADRMRAAKPAEQQFGGAAARAPRPRPLPWTSEEITTPYTQAPTSTHGKVFFTLGGNDYVCSGTALLSGNKSVVWTAGHCVNEGPGAFATNWQFVPAYKDGSAPLGVYTAQNLYAPSAWANSGDFSYDLGAAVVGPASGTRAHRPCRRSRDRVQLQPVAELPVLRLSGRAAVHRRAPVALQLAAADAATPRPTPRRIGIGCDMTGGSSGGGWIVGSSVYSVNSYGYDNQPDVMYGPYQGSVAQSLYNAAAAA